jgi:hypothetical protein
MHVFLCSTRQLLGIPSQVLQQGLTHKKIEAKMEEVLRRQQQDCLK